MRQGDDTKVIEKVPHKGGKVAAALVHEQLDRDAVQRVSFATIAYRFHQCPDDPLSVFSLGLFVAQVKRVAEVIRDDVTDDPLPGDLHQFPGLVLVIDFFVQKTHTAALKAVEDADRGVDLPCVVGVQAAQLRGGTRRSQLVRMAGVAAHGAGKCRSAGHDDFSGLRVDNAEAVGGQTLAGGLDGRDPLAGLALAQVGKSPDSKCQLPVDTGLALVRPRFASAAPARMLFEKGVHALFALSQRGGGAFHDAAALTTNGGSRRKFLCRFVQKILLCGRESHSRPPPFIPCCRSCPSRRPAAAQGMPANRRRSPRREGPRPRNWPAR